MAHAAPIPYPSPAKRERERLGPPMRDISPRGQAPVRDFADVLVDEEFGTTVQKRHLDEPLAYLIAESGEPNTYVQSGSTRMPPIVPPSAPPCRPTPSGRFSCARTPRRVT
jgi:hypothetical protein